MINKLPHDHGKHTEKILALMPSEEKFIEAADLFKQLNDSTRLRILWILCHTEDCGINIASAVNMSPAAVAHHLKILKLHGLITSRRDGKEVYYKLAETDVANLIHQMIDSYFEMVCPNEYYHHD